MKNLVLRGMAALLVSVSFPLFAEAASLPEAPHVVINARGEVDAMPDIAYMQLQISETSDSAVQAKSTVDQRSAQVLNAVAEQGVPESDIRASQIRIYPDYEWHDGKRVLRGQRVERSIDITLKDLSRYGAVLDALVNAGISELGNIRFDLSQRDALQAEAVQLAIGDAKARAEVLAAGFGRKLAGVYHIDEGASAPVVYERAMMMDAKLGAQAPMLIGEETVTANLTVVFLLK